MLIPNLFKLNIGLYPAILTIFSLCFVLKSFCSFYSFYFIPPLVCHRSTCMCVHSCCDPAIILGLLLASSSLFLLPLPSTPPTTSLQISVVSPLQLDMDIFPCTLPEQWHTLEPHCHLPCICVCVDVTSVHQLGTGPQT